LPKTGLLSLEGLTTELETKISVKDLKDLKIPMIVAVSNITEAKIEYMDHGKISQIITASSSIPVVFSPVKIGNSVYVDGVCTIICPLSLYWENVKNYWSAYKSYPSRIKI
jgi:NTE family protein